MSVVAAFPATGKSFAAGRDHRLLDSDSSSYSWAESYVRHPAWPENYIEHVQECSARGDVVLCSTHDEVREALHGAGVPFALVYPSEDQRDDYLTRLRRRGSPPTMVDLIGTMWWDFLASCRAQEGCAHIVLGHGQYLADVLPAAVRSVVPSGDDAAPTTDQNNPPAEEA